MQKSYRHIFLLFLIPALGFSQELKVVKEHPYENVYLEYHVQAQHPKIREGLYQKFITSSLRLVERGYYKNNLKDSLWVHLNILGDTTESGNYSKGLKNGYWKKWIFPSGNAVISCEGNYKDDKHVGVWTFSKPDGSLDHKYDYSTSQVVEYGKSNDASTIIDGKDTITAIIDKPAIHIGGMDTLYEILARNIRMPIQVRWDRKANFHYRVFVSFVVDENGRLKNYAIARGDNKACNEEAIRAVKLWDDGNWVHGYYNGHAVKVMQMVPVVFNTIINDSGPFPPPNAVILR